MSIHLKIYVEYDISIQFYGITQDPETHSYKMVLKYAEDGNLREYLKINFNNINRNQKLYNLSNLSYKLMNVHRLDIVHQDFHPGNILSSNFRNCIRISDFGLSKLMANPNNYTKAADIYSFGIIAYEMITGFPPHPNIPHYKNLAMKICNGLRLKIPFYTPKLILQKWDELGKCRDDYVNYLHGRNMEEFSANQESTNTTTTTATLNYQTNPQAIYTSLLLNYSNIPKPRNGENFD
ncbi:hypothetical protein Glove_256g200 [Diversispora epigaea]|uniref:Protein kinase domain-containing protein n=1 Tax=Diversispora epigaea TaxID=1348612 RepID=A0A397I757_9GLOM|nr:hypothetical protein Glove_256g200 [Diversispora epigaea]